MLKGNTGVRLKKLREAQGMTQADLSEHSGIHRVTVARYEIGDVSMSLENASKLAAALGVTVDELVKEDEE